MDSHRNRGRQGGDETARGHERQIQHHRLERGDRFATLIMIRCGNGYDAHRLAPNRKLILGGVEIPYERGLDGHSDADVLCHAIADALLGAVGESDIGHHFPNTDESIRGISSIEILQRVTALLAEIHARPLNVDATLIAEAPKDRKSTRLNSSHSQISYAVFCLKKKNHA